MGLTVKHHFSCAIPDDAAAVAAGQVTPQAAWNHEHDITGTLAGFDANPTGSVGLTAVNGVAVTYMRSDAAPALDQTAAYAFTGLAQVAGTNPSTTNPFNFLKVTSGDVNTPSSFYISQSGAANSVGSRMDQSFSWGYNLTPSGRVNTSDNANGWVIEDYYNPTGTPQTEIYIQYYGADGTSRRPIFITTPLGTHIPSTAFGGNVNYNTADQVTTYATWSPTGGLVMANGVGIYSDNDIRGNARIAVGNQIASGTSVAAMFYAKDNRASVSMRLENTNVSNKSWEFNAYQDGKFYVTHIGGLSDIWLYDPTSGNHVGGSARKLAFSSTTAPDGTADAFFGRGAAATLQLGAAAAASPVAQTLQAQGSRAGTDSNVGGANLTVTPGNGTGTGTPAVTKFQSPVKVASGTGAQTQTDTLIMDQGTARRPGQAFASLPASPVAGMTAYITDSTTTTWGATITGGGSNPVLGWYNGAAWKVYAA